MGKVLLHLLTEGLRQTDWTFVLFGDEPRAPLHAPVHQRIETSVREVKGHRFRLWEQIALPLLARRFNCDVLHCPGTWCCWWQPVPTVVTIHDTLPWAEGPSDIFVRHIAPAAYHQAAHIITPSESSSADIRRRWPRLRPPITVIPWAVDDAYFTAGSTTLSAALSGAGVSPPYLLYLGGEIPRKRLDWALTVWRALTDRPDLQLVLCGLQKPHEFPSHKRITALGFVAEADMPALYASAEAVVYPTLYEGFGFPALESQACGTPVLMSAAGSLKELAGPSALVLPTDDLKAWVDAVRAAPQHRRATAEAARVWSRRFSWPDVWRKFEEVFRRAADVGPVMR
jgi:glycosyltransferase involved in cell wall biosynthesis